MLVATKNDDDPRRFLHPDTIAGISRLDLRARQVVEGFISGMHRSPFFGHSVEFVQHRDYTPGDDIRHLDWKVWSKTVNTRSRSPQSSAEGTDTGRSDSNHWGVINSNIWPKTEQERYSSKNRPRYSRGTGREKR